MDVIENGLAIPHAEEMATLSEANKDTPLHQELQQLVGYMKTCAEQGNRQIVIEIRDERIIKMLINKGYKVVLPGRYSYFQIKW